MNSILFEQFFSNTKEESLKLLHENIDEYSEYFAENIYIDFTNILSRKLELICMRTLIFEMHLKKELGELLGKNSNEEYKYYCSHFLSDTNYVTSILEKYEELDKSMHLCAENLINYYTELVENYIQDQNEIEHLIEGNTESKKITMIESDISDVHNGGKTVVKLEVDNKYIIVYKPRNMDNEKIFYNFMRLISDKLSIQMYNYWILSKKDHSWSCFVEHEECFNMSQVKCYFYYLGMYLFGAYFWGSRDLHCENIIAHKEYPVLIDLENLTNFQFDYDDVDTKDSLRRKLYESVLCTGILPAIISGNGSYSIDVCGIGGEKDKNLFFKMPMLINKYTSNMKIEYRYPIIKEGKNVIKINGEIQNPNNYVKELIKGFEDSYNVFLVNKNVFFELLEKSYEIKNRVLFAHTQLYSMFLLSSYHPSLMVSELKRRDFLAKIREERYSVLESVVDEEIESLLVGDIPYFYMINNSRDLYSNHKIIVNNYINKIMYEKLQRRVCWLNKNDLVFQVKLIKSSIRLVYGDESAYRNNVYMEKLEHISINKDQINDILAEMIDMVLQNVEWDESLKCYNWISLRASNEGDCNWKFDSLGPYLYDGLAGMLLGLTAINMIYKDKIKSEIINSLKTYLFRYTNLGLESMDNLNTHMTGIYNGESSIIYTYLCLYNITKDMNYLSYAEKHVCILGKIIDEDTSYDLISGNAGAIIVLLKLYDKTFKDSYIKLAESASDILLNNINIMENGIGWKNKDNEMPMAGMAHGNSGFLIAFLMLWNRTQKDIYLKTAYEIIKYEDSLYCEDLNNWLDVRSVSSQLDSVAWCHGSAGILAARICCIREIDNIWWKNILSQDIEKAYKKTKQFWKRDSLSLCHGTCGNLSILEMLGGDFVESFVRQYQGKRRLLPQEEITMGLMNGIMGSIYYILNNIDKSIPNILFLED